VARIPYPDRDSLPEDLRQYFDRQRERGGYEVNVFRALARSPEVMGGFNGIFGYLNAHSPLDPALRELAILTVGMLTAAPYEYEHHVDMALRVGVTRAQIDALRDWARSSEFDDRQRAVIRYAWQATERVRVSDTVADAVHSLLDDDEFFDLATTVAFYNMVVRLLEPLQIELEEAFLARRAR
jgi:alkylhydroperoxidase family enzyme